MLLWVVACLLMGRSVTGDGSLVRRTSYGPVVGTVLHSLAGEQYLGWMAIPYAKPPVGELRFQAPEPPVAWQDEFDATRDAAQCLQYSFFEKSSAGREDCLTLNIYTPKDASSRARDVMFHLHGGGLTGGSGNKRDFDAAALVAKGVVVVSINYRLGILGFLSTGNEVVPGNNGFKDQVLALRWVKDNIAEFGGNPDSVTIFGCSAGGWSVHSLLISRLSRGLFHRAIAQSGVSTSSLMLDRNAPVKAKALGHMLNCTAKTSEKLVACLRHKDASEIVKQMEYFYEWGLFPVAPFGAVVESDYEDSFFTTHPWEALYNGDYSPVPYMTGITADDGSLFAAMVLESEKNLNHVNSERENLFPLLFDYEHAGDQAATVTEKIRQFYLNDSDVIDASNAYAFMDAFGDRIFLSPMIRSVQTQASSNSAPIYVYQFAFTRETPSYHLYMPKVSYDYGVPHGEEMYYLSERMFGFTFNNKTANEKQLTDIMTTMWTNFARTGNPTPDASLNFTWDTVTTSYVNFLNITLYPEMFGEDGWPMKRIDFWDMLHNADMKTTYDYHHNYTSRVAEHQTDHQHSHNSAEFFDGIQNFLIVTISTSLLFYLTSVIKI